MIKADVLYNKKNKNESFTIEECQWLAYYESLKSRNDSDHEPGHDPLVGAVVRNKEGKIIACAHRANGLEGDHAEFSIIEGQLKGEDISDCIFFTTLEPCVDDVRNKEGMSCSSLLSKSAIKVIYIGILDPNPSVYSIGLEKLFNAGKEIHPFSEEVKKEILKLYPPKTEQSSIDKILRVKRTVFSKFQKGVLKKYLSDKYFFEHQNNEGFILDDEENAFAEYLLNKEFVSFEAKKEFVDNSIQIMFYDEKYLNTTNRKIRINNNYDESFSEINQEPLPLLIQKIECIYLKLQTRIPYEVVKEAFVNAVIHGNYDSNAPLTYFNVNKLSIKIENDASPNISQTQLDKLPSFEATPEPGNGSLVELARLAGYCERDKRGEKTFKEYKDNVICNVENRHVQVIIKLF